VRITFVNQMIQYAEAHIKWLATVDQKYVDPYDVYPEDFLDIYRTAENLIELGNNYLLALEALQTGDQEKAQQALSNAGLI